MEMLWMMDFLNIYAFNLQSFVAVFIYAVFMKPGEGRNGINKRDRSEI